MHDLEQAIAEWRRDIIAAFPDSVTVVEELEMHLRDHIEHQMQAGIPVEQAFADGVVKLGEAQCIAAEFEKIPIAVGAQGLLTKVVWSAFGLVLLVLAIALGRACLGPGKLAPIGAGHVFALTVGYIAAFFGGALAVWHSINVRIGSDSPPNHRVACHAIVLFGRICVGFVTIGFLLGLIWAQQSWGAGWLWQDREIGALLVVLSAALVAGRSVRSPSANSVCSLALLASGITTFAWFGASAIDKGGKLLWVPITLVVLQFAASVLSMRHLSEDHSKALRGEAA